MPHYKKGFLNLPLLSSQSCLSSKLSNFNFEWTSHQALIRLMSFWLCSLILDFWWKHLTSKNNPFIFSTRIFAARTRSGAFCQNIKGCLPLWEKNLGPKFGLQTQSQSEDRQHRSWEILFTFASLQICCTAWVDQTSHVG